MKRKNFMFTTHFSYDDLTQVPAEVLAAYGHNAATIEKLMSSNTPDSLQMVALENLSKRLLEPLYNEFGPLQIETAFRSQALNEAMHGLGGLSRHLSGEAVDLLFTDLDTGRAYYRYILRHGGFDQLMFQYRRGRCMRLHCSVMLDDRENRHQSFPNYELRGEHGADDEVCHQKSCHDTL